MKDSKADVWHVYYGDVQVGTIGMRSGVPNDVDQWGWTCGFISQRLKITEGTAPPSTWRVPNLRKRGKPTCPAASMPTSPNIASNAPGRPGSTQCMTPMRLPTQISCGRARCFCGAEIGIVSMSPHVNECHNLGQP